MDKVYYSFEMVIQFLYQLPGSQYIGEYKKDKKNGSGTFKFANGNQYSG